MNGPTKSQIKIAFDIPLEIRSVAPIFHFTNLIEKIEMRYLNQKAISIISKAIRGVQINWVNLYTKPDGTMLT